MTAEEERLLNLESERDTLRWRHRGTAFKCTEPAPHYIKENH